MLKCILFYVRPFERTREENESIYHLVKMFDTLTGQVEPHVLKELCSVAILDVWDEEGITGKSSSLKIS